MKLTRRTANILLAAGIFMLFSWTTRLYTFLSVDLPQQAGTYLPLVHLPLILISLAIGGYLTYLGVRGRRATRR